MNSYEAMVILRPELDKESLDKTLTQVQDAISKNKGVSDQVKEWGKQKFTFPIKKRKEGAYYLINFHAETSAVSKLKRNFALNDAILRAMITRT